MAIFTRYGWLRRVATIGGRYGIATVGPVAVSGANFLASLALLRTLPPAHFGLYAFILIVMGFCFSLSNALIASPYTVAANQRDFGDGEARTFFKVNLLFSISVGLVCGGIALAMHAGGNETAVLFGLFGTLAMLRWFARAHCYATHAPLRVATVDIAYASLMLSGLGLTWVLHDLTLDKALITFVLAGAAAVLASGRDYLKRQFIEVYSGHLRGYVSIWYNQARWSLLGVATTEASLNAHAYLVTLIAGPAAFAPLAAAALFMKPLSMCSNSLMQLERPAMARAIAIGHFGEALRHRRHFRWALMLCWLATIALAATIFLFFPKLVLSDSYDLKVVMIAAALWAIIEGTQAWLAPDAALLQAADRFRLLAGATVRSSIVTAIAAFALLIIYGPVASLVGVLLGEIVLATRFAAIKREWKFGT